MLHALKARAPAGLLAFADIGSALDSRSTLFRGRSLPESAADTADAACGYPTV
jgi:hypothetical protein